MAVSTPNAAHMFQPMYGHDRVVQLRTDYMFGIDDPLRHPQAYWPNLRRLACMLTPTTNHENSHLWRQFRPEWAERTSSSIDGIYRLKKEVLLEMKTAGHAFVKSIDELKKDVVRGACGSLTLAEFDCKEVKRGIYNLERSWLLLGRPATMNDLLFRYVNAQRFELNLRARVDDMTIFGPRFESPQHEPREVSGRRMGAMTTSLADAEMLYQAGLPVWYVYDAQVCDPSKFERFLSETEVKGIRDAVEIPPSHWQMGSYEGYMKGLDYWTGDSNKPFTSLTPIDGALPLWNGAASHPSKYAPMSEVLGMLKPGFLAPDHPLRLGIPDSSAGSPLLSSSFPEASTSHIAASTSMFVAPAPSSQALLAPPTSIEQTASISSTSSTTSAKRAADSEPSGHNTRAPKKAKTKRGGPQRQQEGRSRFEDVTSGAMPLASPFWLRCLQDVGQQHQLTGRERPTYLGGKVKYAHTWYVMPEAAMIASATKDETRSLMLRNYIRLRPWFQYRAENFARYETTPPTLHPQEMRSLLCLKQSPDAGKTDTRAGKRRANILEEFTKSTESAGIQIDLHKLADIPCIWDGVDYSAVDVLPADVSRRLLWEMNETQSRIDLVSLDFWMYDWPSTSDRAWISNRVGGNIPMVDTIDGCGDPHREEGQDDLTPEERRNEVINDMGYWHGSVFPERMEDDGFVSRDPMVRRKAVVSLLNVINFWGAEGYKLSEPFQRIILKIEKDNLYDVHISLWPAPDVDELTRHIVPHYIDLFTRVFKRPPVIPRVLRDQF
ncbi:hypothetical protein CYLTODRAFT_427410 [Cylindrobasidium torrendii FP15055 ss-10]|uniref:Uncharacterized protein n=1 Tax=Cylindrobasidium torrendii FP15055 ss-10 TaxID=1314674 RepID=A0A0D7AV26_9AGAR|nr:hypothetical protein CYLTODRAFT_427410 [Cylindrobasidium torrendii FP15055 ss-10]